MKIRAGFVSNSSSSSFVCEICGEIGSGWDASPADVGMIECKNGHVFCVEHALDCDENGNRPYSEVDEYCPHCTKAYPDEDKENFIISSETGCCYSCGESSFGDEVCPICAFTMASNHDLARYLEKITGVSRSEAFEQVKALNKRRKKLYDNEYVMYVAVKHNIQTTALLEELKTKFGTYEAFMKFLGDYRYED
ncbi:MAG: hypothetical protein WCY37_03555 [Candidatus Dojkabacteria bacterium]